VVGRALHRERRDGWAAKVAAQAAARVAHRLRGHDELADAIVAQLAAREIEQDDAIDALHTACYLAEGVSAKPCVHAAEGSVRCGPCTRGARGPLCWPVARR
jgi:hypothetical protein